MQISGFKYTCICNFIRVTLGIKMKILNLYEHHAKSSPPLNRTILITNFSWSRCSFVTVAYKLL